MVGSLIPGQVLHAGVDLLVGVAGAVAVSKLSAAENSAGAGTLTCSLQLPGARQFTFQFHHSPWRNARATLHRGDCFG